MFKNLMRFQCIKYINERLALSEPNSERKKSQKHGDKIVYQNELYHYSCYIIPHILGVIAMFVAFLFLLKLRVSDK